MDTSLIILFCVLFAGFSESQFAYPADPNPPQIDTTFSCFACNGVGCDITRERGEHDEESCTGPRVACWITKNMETSVYARTCEQPPSIRQGVFCNRHMEGREFCYAYDSPQGRVRLCSKCCLGNRCNSGELKGIPDEDLQSCVACQGGNDENCNSDFAMMDLENSTYAEQCLLPNSDCWTEKRRRNGNDIYFRGCQLRTCNDDNMRTTCSTESGQEICETCCQGKFCNRFTSGASRATSYGLLFALVFAASKIHFV